RRPTWDPPRKKVKSRRAKSNAPISLYCRAGAGRWPTTAFSCTDIIITAICSFLRTTGGSGWAFPASDPREALAADLFGFPRFTRDGVSALDLSENECSTDGNFGHWCRPVR